MNLLQSKFIEIHKLSLNTGQIPDVPKNPRFIKTERYEKLKKSLEDNPEMLPARELLVYNYDGELIVIGGNMRLRAAKELGYKEIPCKVLEDLTPEQIRAIVIKDNVSFGSDDFEQLANEWDSIKLEEWGLEVPTFDEIQPELEAVEDDYTERENMQVDVCLGDLIEIGQHRLLCGDSTDSEQVARLMNGEKADMVFSDPPYGIDWNTDYTRFKGGMKTGVEYTKIKNDEKIFNPSYFLLTYENCFFFGANCFSDKLPKGNWIVWDKRFESGAAFLADAEVAWYNGSGAVYIISEINQGFVNSDKKKYHPTQKPIKLLEKIFEKIKAPNFLFDPYLGSGSTMVAAHQLNRKCYGIEIEPKYCQVIIDRMHKLDRSLKIKINGKDYISKNN